MKIVPSAGTDLGDLGQQQGNAASYDWMWYYSASGMLIWLVLILAIVVPKANRDLRILWILVPLVIVNLLWLAFKKLSGMPSSSASQLDTVFHSVAVGIAALWLAASYFGKLGGFVRFLISLGILVAVACLGTLSYFTEFLNVTALFFALLVFMALTMLVAMTLSRKLCGGTYRPVCFMLWLALWTLLVSFVAMFGFVVAVSIIFSSWPDLSEGTLRVVMGGLTFGANLYVLNLPFMILGFMNPFFRERFCACLGLKPMLASAGSDADSDRPNVQDVNPAAP